MSSTDDMSFKLCHKRDQGGRLSPDGCLSDLGHIAAFRLRNGAFITSDYSEASSLLRTLKTDLI